MNKFETFDWIVLTLSILIGVCAIILSIKNFKVEILEIASSDNNDKKNNFDFIKINLELKLLEIFYNNFKKGKENIESERNELYLKHLISGVFIEIKTHGRISPYLDKMEKFNNVKLTEKSDDLTYRQLKLLNYFINKTSSKSMVNGLSIYLETYFKSNNSIIEELTHTILEELGENEISSSDKVSNITDLEKQQQAAEERLERIRAYTAKLKTSEGITKLELEPAYERKVLITDIEESSPTETKYRPSSKTNESEGEGSQ